MNTTDWQSWAALAIVILTALIFARRALKKKSASCGSCGCDAAAAKKSLARKSGGA